MSMLSVIKVQGPNKEVIREIDGTPYDGAMEAYAEAIKANKRGKANYLTKFLVTDSLNGKVIAGYYAIGLQYTEG